MVAQRFVYWSPGVGLWCRTNILLNWAFITIIVIFITIIMLLLSYLSSVIV